MTVPPIPKRSRLYSLEPMNVGTAEVESLTGYVARIAEAHCVTVSDLVGAELSDPACPTPLFTPYPGKGRSNFFYTQLYSVNGIADVPRKWVSVLETATLRQGLSDLTLLAFADLFSESHLFRNVSAWCPSCFESRRRCGVRYESLLWAIGIVKVCPLHREPLEEICPHCRRRSRPLAAHARPGYCSRCGGWLGSAGGSTEKSMSESDLEREIWIAKSIGDLLAAAPRAERVSAAGNVCGTNLSACIESATSGNLLAFADITRTPRGALRYWVSGMHRPQIGALLRMCYQIGVPVTQLLGDPAAADFDIAPLRNDRGIQLRRRGDEVRLALDRALAEEPPPSVSELARRLHFARSRAPVPDRPRQVQDAGGKASRGYPSVTAKAFTGASEVRAASDEAHIGGFAGARVSGIDYRNCRAEWLRERRLHQAGVPRSLPGHRPEDRSTKESRNERKGRDPESCAGGSSAAHGGANGRKAGFRVSWSSAAKFSCAIPGASWAKKGIRGGTKKAVTL